MAKKRLAAIRQKKLFCHSHTFWERQARFLFATQPSLQLPKSYDELNLVSLQFHRQKLGVKLEGCKNALKIGQSFVLVQGAINARIR